MCSREYIRPLISPPLHLCVSWTLSDVGIRTDPYTRPGLQVSLQSPHPFPSEGNARAPSSAHCAAPLPRPSLFLLPSPPVRAHSQNGHSPIRLPVSPRIIIYLLLISCFSHPCLYRHFLLSLDTSSSYLQPSFLLMQWVFFQIHPQEGFGPSLSITYRL